jgi:hypothetical protein
MLGSWGILPPDSVLLDAPVPPPSNCRRRCVQAPLTNFGSVRPFGYLDDGGKEGNCVRAAGSQPGRADIMVIIIIICFHGPSFDASPCAAALSQRKLASAETSRTSCSFQGHDKRYAL